ncbi:MAG: hypothetical protein ACYTBJ_14060 [Planctomycetota bacterium]
MAKNERLILSLAMLIFLLLGRMGPVCLAEDANVAALFERAEQSFKAENWRGRRGKRSIKDY